MVITKLAASTTSSVRGLGNSATTGDTDLVQYLHHQWVEHAGDPLLEPGIRLRAGGFGRYRRSRRALSILVSGYTPSGRSPEAASPDRRRLRTHAWPRLRRSARRSISTPGDH